MFKRNQFVCRQVVALVTAYLDGVLDGSDRQRFEAHIAGCPHCTRYLDQIRKTVAASNSVQFEDLSDAAHTDLTDVYRRWREEQS